MNNKFIPNITRFKKSRRRNNKGIETDRSAMCVKYPYGIKALERGRLHDYHIEMMRRTITNFYKRKYKLFIRVFPMLSYTSKPNDVRRGRGKGSVESWYYPVKKNKVILEFQSDTLSNVKKLFLSLRPKVPLKVNLTFINNESNL